jgi:hypothetical protein
MTANTIRTLLTTLAVAGTLASSALAAGEPKNQYPFTRTIGAPGQATLTATVRQASHIIVQTGEPKNEPPFTRR